MKSIHQSIDLPTQTLCYVKLFLVPLSWKQRLTVCVFSISLGLLNLSWSCIAQQAKPELTFMKRFAYTETICSC